MNSCWILLLLLFRGQNRCCDRQDTGCGCDSDRQNTPCCNRDNRDNRSSDSCPCDDSRFEPRFDSRPFGGGPSCGCDEK